MLPILYSFRRCPYAIRARLALTVAGVQVELREVVLRDKPPQMLAISPKGTVPVLQCADGRVLEQSLEIMRWALALHDPQGWLRQGDKAESGERCERAESAESAEGDRLIATNDGPFKALLDRYKYPERQPGTQAAAARDEAVALLLAPLEQRLQRSACLLGDTPALADMALLPFVRQFARVDAAWFDTAPLPALQAWLARLTGTPLFHAVMAKLAPWQPSTVGPAP